MSNNVFEYLDIAKIYNSIFDHRKKARFRNISLQK